MKNIELTDEAVILIMEKYKIGREEAEKRLRLLFESGIIELGVEKDNTKMLIYNFLAKDSETL